MIGLNKIGLNQVQLNRLRLNAPFPTCRKMAGGGGSSDGFPQLPGDVTRWHFGGLTNEMMAAMDDPRIEDADHKGRFLSFKNFAWGGMSGVGGYTENYNSNKWYKVESRIDATWTYKSFNARSIKDNRLAQLFYQSSLSDTGFRVLSCTIKVSGLTDGQGIEYVSNGTQQFVIMRIENDGIYHLPSFDFGAKNAYYGFKFLKLQESCNITIEQLPLYPGALVFDGVDDYGVCENFPILTKEKGYTVVALRQWITRGERALGLVSNVKDWLNNGAFLLEYRNIQADHLNKPISFGAIGSEMDLPHILTYQTSKSYNGVSITTGNFEGTDVLHVGKLAPTNVGTCINAAIWEIVILDHDATEEELTKIKDYFIKTYPWLFPDQAWTVTGKTNEDEDRATIANITGNGNDLVLSNFGFAKGSGYGLYAQNYSNSRWFFNNSITATKKSDTFNVTSINQVSVQIQYIAEPSQSPYTVPSYTVKITGLTDGQTVIYRVLGGISYPITQDGIYILPGFDFAGMGSWYGFQFNKIQESCDITIEQIPEYEGYLVTDGVDDRVQDSSFKLNKDWTLVGEWVLLNQKATNAGIVKPFSFVIYNRTTGLSLFINSGTSGTTIENVKSIKAICSDGRIYLDDWSEMLINKDQNITSSTSVLSIGFNGTAYTQIALKNLGIYNDQLLSKDDCIKAYNYLQTYRI